MVLYFITFKINGTAYDFPGSPKDFSADAQFTKVEKDLIAETLWKEAVEKQPEFKGYFPSDIKLYKANITKMPNWYPEYQEILKKIKKQDPIYTIETF